MTEAADRLLEMAREEIAVASSNTADGFLRAGVSRAYYALFYLAEALLVSEGQTYSKHSAVIAAFGQRFARSKRLDPRFHGYLKRAFELRNSADYALVSSLTQDEVRTVIAWAQEFLDAAAGFLGLSAEASA